MPSVDSSAWLDSVVRALGFVAIEARWLAMEWPLSSWDATIV